MTLGRSGCSEVFDIYTHPQQGAGEEAQRLRREAGKWLKRLREQRNLTQRQLAARVGVDYYTFISQIEAGRGRIPPDRCEVWAQALGVDVTEFVKQLMSYYDPITYDLLFGREATRDDSGTPRDARDTPR